MMDALGYFGALVMGFILGLLGGGGSVITVPILVYLLRVDVVLATAYSLFIVGASSFFGALSYWRKGLVRIKTGIYFGIPSVIMVFITRKWILPNISDVWFTLGTWSMTKDLFILILFSGMMIISAYYIIRVRVRPLNEKTLIPLKNTWFVVIAEGLLIGLLTGLVGAGGGFVIVPALMLFFHLEIKEAVATSLFIITIKSLVGFVGDLTNYQIDWSLLLLFTSLAVVGIFFGSIFSSKVSGKNVKKIFGWLLLVMGVFMLFGELLFSLFN
jgi:hypothetical protein